MDQDDPVRDPYRRCEDHCTHDLARGVTIAELLNEDGPHPDSHLIVSFSLARAAMREDETPRMRDSA